MTIFELWNTLKKKFEPGLAKEDFLDTNCTYRVYLLACLFLEIRSPFYTHKDQKETPDTIHRVATKLFPFQGARSCIIFYQDGQQAFGRSPIYQERLDFADKNVESAQIVWRSSGNDIRNGRYPSKKEEREFIKDKQAMIDYPFQQERRGILTPLKADVTIGKSCGDSDVVVARTVGEYARDPNVHRRNPIANDFKPSPSVFAGLTQKPVKKLRLRNQESRNARRSTKEDHVRRHKNHQASNRFRTVEPLRGGSEDDAS